MEHAQTCQSPPDVVAVMTQSLMTQQPSSPPDEQHSSFSDFSLHILCSHLKFKTVICPF
jgi:hypothetical protein